MPIYVNRSYVNRSKNTWIDIIIPLCMKWKEVDVSTLLVFTFMQAKVSPHDEYESKYSGNNIFNGIPIRCRPPKIKPDINMYITLFLIIDLIPSLNINSSKSGARKTDDIQVYIGKVSNSFLIEVSLLDSPPPK